MPQMPFGVKSLSAVRWRIEDVPCKSALRCVTVFSLSVAAEEDVRDAGGLDGGDLEVSVHDRTLS